MEVLKVSAQQVNWRLRLVLGKIAEELDGPEKFEGKVRPRNEKGGWKCLKLWFEGKMWKT